MDTTILIVLDACRYDYINKKDTPYLCELAKKSITGKIKSPPGFAQRTSMFTGTYPDKSDMFSAFMYSPSTSPFKWIKKTKILYRTVTPRKIIYPLRVFIQKITERFTDSFYSDPAWIPPVYLPYFDMSEDRRPVYEQGALGLTSIFDLIRENNKKFEYFMYPIAQRDNVANNMINKSLDEKQDIDLYLIQYSGPDIYGHKYGPDSDERRKNLSDIDSKIKKLISKMESVYSNVNVLILGDHGMTPVKKYVDLKGMIEKKSGLKAGDDYVMFLDSTIAKFWFKNDKTKKIITDILKTIPEGHFITESEKKRLRINFKDNKYGDLMFFMSPGTMIFPDYFHIIENRVVGMHGYIDDHDATYGALIFNTNKIKSHEDVGVVSLVNVFPTLCDLVGIKTPLSNEGKSMIKQKK